MEDMGKQVEMVETGVRPGEKLHEILLTDFESKSTVVYDEQYLVILPALEIPGLKEHYQHCLPVDFESFCSSEGLMNKADIRKMLVHGGFLS